MPVTKELRVASLTSCRLITAICRWLSTSVSHVLAIIRRQKSPTPDAFTAGTPTASERGSANHCSATIGSARTLDMSSER